MSSSIIYLLLLILFIYFCTFAMVRSSLKLGSTFFTLIHRKDTTYIAICKWAPIQVLKLAAWGYNKTRFFLKDDMFAVRPHFNIPIKYTTIYYTFNFWTKITPINYTTRHTFSLKTPHLWKVVSKPSDTRSLFSIGIAFKLQYIQSLVSTYSSTKAKRLTHCTIKHHG